MGTTDKRVDEYIAKSADLAKPILTHIRAVVHETCPDVEETMKWNSPTYMSKGILCGMVSFKAHCVFGFWKGELVTGDADGGGARNRRLAQAVQWIAEGKQRNWKYM